jgi:hypothetical protein
MSAPATALGGRGTSSVAASSACPFLSLSSARRSPPPPRSPPRRQVVAPLAHNVEAGQERQRTGTRYPLLRPSSPCSPPRAGAGLPPSGGGRPPQREQTRSGLTGVAAAVLSLIAGANGCCRMRLGVGLTVVSVAFGDVILLFHLPHKGYLSLQVGTLVGDSCCKVLKPPNDKSKWKCVLNSFCFSVFSPNIRRPPWNQKDPSTHTRQLFLCLLASLTYNLVQILDV